MKVLLLLGVFTLTILLARAQEPDIALNKIHTEKIRERKQWLLRFEKVNITDVRTGRTLSVSRAFYFDKVRRQLQSVIISETKKRHGLQLEYTYYKNQLVKVKFTPPSDECRKCKEEYYYCNNQLLLNGNNTIGRLRNGNYFIEDAAFLKAKVPDFLEPGYFEWEKPSQIKDGLAYTSEHD